MPTAASTNVTIRPGLNFGDCFAYVLAKERDLPLLFKGEDFSRTDLRTAMCSPAAWRIRARHMPHVRSYSSA
jgi:hypothetical protein